MTGYGCTFAEWLDALGGITFHGQTLARTVPDRDGEAAPDIPSDVLHVLGPTDVIIHPDGRLYMRESLFKRLAPQLPGVQRIQ